MGLTIVSAIGRPEKCRTEPDRRESGRPNATLTEACQGRVRIRMLRNQTAFPWSCKAMCPVFIIP